MTKLSIVKEILCLIFQIPVYQSTTNQSKILLPAKIKSFKPVKWDTLVTWPATSPVSSLLAGDLCCRSCLICLCHHLISCYLSIVIVRYTHKMPQNTIKNRGRNQLINCWADCSWVKAHLAVFWHWRTEPVLRQCSHSTKVVQWLGVPDLSKTIHHMGTWDFRAVYFF